MIAAKIHQPAISVTKVRAPAATSSVFASLRLCAIGVAAPGAYPMAKFQ